MKVYYEYMVIRIATEREEAIKRIEECLNKHSKDDGWRVICSVGVYLILERKCLEPEDAGCPAHLRTD